MKCYKCESELAAGNLSYFCSQMCKDAYWAGKPNLVKKYDSVKNIQERCRILAQEGKSNKPAMESASVVFDGGLF